jgi:hypothetical protein
MDFKSNFEVFKATKSIVNQEILEKALLDKYSWSPWLNKLMGRKETSHFSYIKVDVECLDISWMNRGEFHEIVMHLASIDNDILFKTKLFRTLIKLIKQRVDKPMVLFVLIPFGVYFALLNFYY